MTLIAAFPSFGVPALIGDLLISSGGKPSSVRKKIVRISPNCAVGWTGHLFAASPVIALLQTNLDLTSVTFEAVRELLTTRGANETGALHVTLVGWVIDSTGRYCFRWRSDYAHEVFLGEAMYDGNGGAEAEGLIGSEGYVLERVPETKRTPDLPLRGVRNAMMTLFAPDMVGRRDYAYGFGFAYEALLFDEGGGGFQYLDDTLYVNMRVRLSGEGRVESVDSLGRFCRASHRREVLQLETLHVHPSQAMEVHFIEPPGVETGFVVTPPGIDLGPNVEDAVPLSSKFKFEAKSYALIIHWHGPQIDKLTVLRLPPCPWVKPNPDGIGVAIPRPELEAIYKNSVDGASAASVGA